MKKNRRSITSAAIETYLVRHNGRAIKVYQMPIPGFWGTLSEDVLQLAAERAYKRGWRKVVLTWCDMLSSCCFDNGYAWLTALNVSMANRNDCHYRDDQFLCKLSQSGDVFQEPAPRDPREYDELSDMARAFENDGLDMMYD